MNPFSREIEVEEAELRRVGMRLVHPFETSFGRFLEEEHLIVILRSGGEEGYGEAPLHKAPLFSHEDVETAWHVLGDILLPRAAGKRFRRGEDLMEEAKGVRGHQTAKAALGFAFHDLQARLTGEPLWKHYGGSDRKIPVGVALGVEPSIQALLDQVERYVEEGYKRIKIKIRPGWDLAPVSAVRERFPGIQFTVDANAAYTLKDLPLFKELDRFDLGYIEQPLAWDDLLEHARLQAEISTPICLDESVDSPRAARAAWELKACKVLNLKPTRVGGVEAVLEIHDLCRKAGVPMWCGGRLETGIGRLHNVALATLPGFSLPGDLSASSRYYEEDLVDPPVTVEDGWVRPPSGPGLGHRVRKDLLERVTLAKRVFRLGEEIRP